MLSQWDVCDVVSHLNTIRNLSKRKRTNEFAEINGHFVPKNSCSQTLAQSDDVGYIRKSDFI